MRYFISAHTIFFFQAEDGIRDRSPSRGLGDVYKRQVLHWRLRDLVATQPGELVLGPVGARVDLELRDRHRGAHADLVAALDGDRYFRLLDALDTVLALSLIHISEPT